MLKPSNIDVKRKKSRYHERGKLQRKYPGITRRGKVTSL